MSDLPYLAIELIVQLLGPHCRGVSRHVSTSFRDAVRAVQKKGMSAELTAKNVVADIEAGRNRAMVRWVIEQPGRRIVLSRRVAAALAGAGWLEELKHARARGCQVELCSWIAAARGGRIDVLEWLLAEQGPENGLLIGGGVCQAAAEGGRLDVLEWAVSRGANMYHSTATKAAEGGYIELLEWAVTKGCPWDDQVYVHAIVGGHWGVFRWAADNGHTFNVLGEDRKRLVSIVYSHFIRVPVVSRAQIVEMALTDPVDEGDPVWRVAEASERDVAEFIDLVIILKSDYNFQFDFWSIFQAAARKADLEFLMWLLNHPRWQTYFGGPQSVKDAVVWSKAGEKIDLQLLLHEDSYRPESNFLHLTAAAQGGHADVLHWLPCAGASDTAGFCVMAATHGHLPLLQWAVATVGSEGLSPARWVRAARFGHLSVLQWAADAGYHLDLATLRNEAASNGHMSVVEWVRERGLPTTTETLSAAVGWDHLQILQSEADVAIRRSEANVSGKLQRLLELATSRLDTQVLTWVLHQDLCPALPSGLTMTAATAGHLELLHLLRSKYRYKWDEFTTYCAAKHGHLDVLQWAVANGCPYNLRDIRSVAGLAGGKTDLLRWVDENLAEQPGSQSL